ncbi:MAG: malonyl-CoA decarboxylase [Pseudomonadales bacterium]
MRINEWVSSIADAGRDLLQRSRNGKNGRNIRDLCVELCSSKGEAMGTAIAQEVVQAYFALDEEQKLDFYRLLLSDYSPDRAAILEQLEKYQQADDPDVLQRLGEVVEGPRRRLFRRINMAPYGTSTVLRMRQDLLTCLRDHPELKPVDSDMVYLFRSWFNRGFLTLETISWRTPAHILEKLIAYEAVHEMQGWDDLRRRLADDRRCFAFFHPALPDEPLIFVQVALVKGMAGNVQALLAEPGSQAMEEFDTAIFYSISNCQQGLKGISFGNFLIKQVVLELSREFPQLKNFATLSPIPGFRRWLSREIDDVNSSLLTDLQKTSLEPLRTTNWHSNEMISEAMKPLLIALCAHYLAEVKRVDDPLDPVQRFHLGNGARVERLNWMADSSANGIQQSAGMLVNYGYHLSKVEANHEAFVNTHKVVVSNDFKKLNEEGKELLKAEKL